MTNALSDAFSNLPDEKLISALPAAMDCLLRRYYPVTEQIARAYAANPADSDDFVQEGLLGLIAAASSFSQENGAGFRTYAAVCIRNRMRSYARRLYGDYAAETVSLDNPDCQLADTLADDREPPDAMMLERERFSDLLAQIGAVLSDREMQVISLSARGFSYQEIAQQLHVSSKSVDNAVQRARRKLRAVWSL